ncbi:hypothetical protein FSP39_019100 [Pinctada imbricata]|uniref:BTB domain-containing protein n=1 Tax=Pinctada imbricata TaxID=66713 RepID=A0AA89C0H5_PINIB|nr:hypothetical protein FSP39_019100 [Pinctada imbricata]
MGHYQKFYTNQIYSSSLLCQLAYMWRNDVLCDAVIWSGVISVKAHRVLLIASCPMLQSMESSTVGSQLEVRLAADIKEKSINTFLQYLYEGFMLLTEENCRDIEKIGRLLQVDSVIQCCADFHKSISSRTNVTDTSDFYRFGFHGNHEFRHVRSSDVLTTHGSDFTDPTSRNSSNLRSSRSASGHRSDFTHSNDSSLKRVNATQSKQLTDGKKKRLSQDNVLPQVHPSFETNIPLLHNETLRHVKKSSSPWQSQEQRALTLTDDGVINLADDCILPVNEEGVVNLIEDSIQISETNSCGDQRQSSVGINIISSTLQNSGTEILNLGSDRGPSAGTHKKMSEEDSITSYSRKDDPQTSDVNMDGESPITSFNRDFYTEDSQHMSNRLSDSLQTTEPHDLSNLSAMRSQETFSHTHSEPTPQHEDGTDLSHPSNGQSESTAHVSQATNSNITPVLSASQKQITNEGKVSNAMGKSHDSSTRYEDRRPESSLSAESIDLTIVKHEAVDNQCKKSQDSRAGELSHQSLPLHSRNNPPSLSLMLPPLQHSYPSSSALPFPSSYFALSGTTAGMLPMAMARRRSMEDSMGEKGEKHRMVYITNRKPCVWCQMNRVKTKSGWYCYASYKCVKCDVPLCKQGRDCFMEYHKHIGITSDQLICIESFTAL